MPKILIRVTLAFALSAHAAVSAAAAHADVFAIGSAQQIRRVGAITITADRFIETDDGSTRTVGNLRLGQMFRLTGADAMVMFDGAMMLGSGTLETITGNIALFDGGFRADTKTGVVVPLPGARSRLRHLRGIRPITSAITQVNIPAGTAHGRALVRLGPNQQITSTLGFDLVSGLLFGRLPPVAFQVSGVTIAAPNGLRLIDGGFYAPVARITLPPQFGGSSVIVNELRIVGQDITFGAVDGLFAFPDITLGSSDVIRLSGNAATLRWDPVMRDYHFDISTSLVVQGATPGEAAATVTLATVDGQPQLSGELPQLSFNVAGGVFQMGNVSINVSSG